MTEMAFGDERLPKKFWTRVAVDRVGNCWIWTGNINTLGYSVFWSNGAGVLGHRHAYLSLVGQHAPGLQLDHLCRRRHCVNPAHLEPVTIAENVRRGLAPLVNGRNQSDKTRCPAGHPYDEENTINVKTKAGYGRGCKECRRVHSRNWHRRKAASRRATP
jgi:hypothetical protein